MCVVDHCQRCDHPLPQTYYCNSASATTRQLCRRPGRISDTMYPEMDEAPEYCDDCEAEFLRLSREMHERRMGPATHSETRYLLDGARGIAQARDRANRSLRRSRAADRDRSSCGSRYGDASATPLTSYDSSSRGHHPSSPRSSTPPPPYYAPTQGTGTENRGWSSDRNANNGSPHAPIYRGSGSSGFYDTTFPAGYYQGYQEAPSGHRERNPYRGSSRRY